MGIDPTLTSELDNLARELEDIALVAPAPSLLRDQELTTRVRRIREALRVILASFVTSSSSRSLSFIIVDPDSIKTHLQRGTRSAAMWLNNTGLVFTITRVYAIADTTGYTFTLYKSLNETDIGVANDVSLGSFACSTAGVQGFYVDGTASPATIEDGCWLIWESTAGTADSLSIHVEGSYG